MTALRSSPTIAALAERRRSDPKTLNDCRADLEGRLAVEIQSRCGSTCRLREILAEVVKHEHRALGEPAATLLVALLLLSFQTKRAIDEFNHIAAEAAS